MQIIIRITFRHCSLVSKLFGSNLQNSFGASAFCPVFLWQIDTRVGQIRQHRKHIVSKSAVSNVGHHFSGYSRDFGGQQVRFVPVHSRRSTCSNCCMLDKISATVHIQASKAIVTLYIGHITYSC